MDITSVLQAISTVGFPIVACAALFIRMEKSDQNHKEEIDKLSEAVNNNTVVMAQLMERLRDDRE